MTDALYVFASMFGTYEIACTVLETHEDGYTISFTDPFIDEEVTRKVGVDLVIFKTDTVASNQDRQTSPPASEENDEINLPEG